MVSIYFSHWFGGTSQLRGEYVVVHLRGGDKPWKCEAAVSESGRCLWFRLFLVFSSNCFLWKLAWKSEIYEMSKVGKGLANELKTEWHRQLSTSKTSEIICTRRVVPQGGHPVWVTKISNCRRPWPGSTSREKRDFKILHRSGPQWAITWRSMDARKG